MMPSTLSDPAYRAFVTHLAGLRGRLGVSQVELAARLGKPQSYVSKTERFERRLDPAEFRAFARALGADPVEEFAAVSAGLDVVSGKYSGK